MITERLNGLSRDVIGVAIEVHRELGPGLLESAYEIAIIHELSIHGISAQQQVPVPLTYKGVNLNEIAYRIDILVEQCLVVELKSVASLKPIHHKQLHTYLKLANKRLGLLINFNEKLLKDGIHRIVN